MSQTIFYRAEHLPETTELLRGLLHWSRQGVTLWSKEGEILLANRRAGEILGAATAGALEGLNFRTLPSWRESALLPAAERVFETGEPQHLSLPATRTSFNKLIWLELDFVSTRLPGGDEALLVLFEDISEKKEAEALFNQAAENIGEVVWMRTRKRMLYVSPGYETVWQRSRESLYEDPDSFLRSVHPEDREKVLESFGSDSFDMTYRITRPDGAVRWVQARSTRMPSEHGEEPRYIGIAEDVTAEQERTEELQQKERMLSATAAATNELLVERDLEKAIRHGLSLLGEATGVDRAYFFENHYDPGGNGYTSQRFEWNSGSSPPQINNPELQNVPFSELPEFIEAIRSEEAFIAKVRELPAGALKELLHSQVIVSILILPIFNRGVFAGFVGFDDCTEEREWSEAEYSILRAFSTSLAGAIERRNIERELAAARDAAEAANRAKSQFLANMSHEIRTPLNAILGISQFLNREATQKLNAREKEGLGLISESGNRLLTLINEILDLSRIEAGQMELNIAPFSLPDLLRSAELIAESLKERYQAAVEFYASLDENLPEQISGDEGRINQILTNLISNALKFTRSGEVRLEATRLGGQLLFRVSDTGPGIPVEAQASLFSSFTQVDTSDSREFGGAGLGLALSRQLARMMGGEVFLSSREGEGTTVELRLPFDPREIRNGGELTGRAEFHPQAVSEPRGTILVADDDPASRMTLRLLLSDAGYEVILAAGGREAVSLAGQARPDLVLMDISMPDLDGISAKAELQRENSKLPVIAVTANAMKEEQERIEKAGFNDYLSKPVDFSLLLELVRKHIRQGVTG